MFPGAGANTAYHSRKFDGNAVVRVRAQVMQRDDSTGGWVPMGGGGLSNVSVRKRKIHHEDDQPCRHEYLIHGKRISDQRVESDEVVLSCTIKKDFEYNKVMPTFHHWKTGNKKFGLTFQTAADARAFDKGVRLAVEDLLDAKSLACPHKHYREIKKKGISESSPLHQYNVEVGDDDVFMQLDLPMDKSDSRRSSPPDSSSAGRSPSPPEDLSKAVVLTTSSPRSCSAAPWTSAAHLQAMAHERRGLMHEKIEFDKDYSYVKFPLIRQPPHDYSYPKLSDVPDLCKRRDSASSLKKLPMVAAAAMEGLSSSTSCGAALPFLLGDVGSGNGKKPSPPPLPMKPDLSGGGSVGGGVGGPSSGSFSGSAGGAGGSVGGGKVTCAHCRESFSYDANPRGSCQYAPDCVRRGIEAVTCLQCAKCLLYHCMSDSEGDYAHPCDCSDADGHRTRRWIGLTLLSILVPCLCCYGPMMACYKCGATCNVCGGRHQT